MQPRPRSDIFIRHLVNAATVRPMLNLLLAMKQGRVPIVPAADPAPMPAPALPLEHPQAA